MRTILFSHRLMNNHCWTIVEGNRNSFQNHYSLSTQFHLLRTLYYLRGEYNNIIYSLTTLNLVYSSIVCSSYCKANSVRLFPFLPSFHFSPKTSSGLHMFYDYPFPSGRDILYKSYAQKTKAEAPQTTHEHNTKKFTSWLLSFKRNKYELLRNYFSSNVDLHYCDTDNLMILFISPMRLGTTSRMIQFFGRYSMFYVFIVD